MPGRKIADVFARWGKTHRAYTNERIAQLIGSNPSTISYLRRGKVAPQPRTLEALFKCVPGFKAAYRAVVGS